MPTSYTYSTNGKFNVIKTSAAKLKPIIILKNVCATSEVGINGCFFNYPNPAKNDGFGISWHVDLTSADTCTSNKQTATGAEMTKGTICGYNDSTGKLRVHIAPVKNFTEMKTKVSALSSANTPRYMIGGGSLYLTSDTNWNSVVANEGWNDPYHQGQVDNIVKNGRSGIGYKDESDGYTYVYLAVSQYNDSTNGATSADLRKLFQDLKCNEAIFLDGGGSSQMQCGKPDNTIFTKNGDGRNVWNMVSLIPPL